MEMITAEVMEKMIAFSHSDGATLDEINHFLKVFSLASTIGRCEGLSPEEQQTLEIAAILHDIGCPYCRQNFGHTKGLYQQREGARIGKEFLADVDIPEDMKKEIVDLIACHHTFHRVKSRVHQVLLEADFLVNAGDGEQYHRVIGGFRKHVFGTETGLALLEQMYG